MLNEPYPVRGVEIEVFDLAVGEEAGKTNSVVGQMRLLSEHSDVVFSRSRIVLEKLLSDQHCQLRGVEAIGIAAGTHMKAMPTMPRPTITTFFRASAMINCQF